MRVCRAMAMFRPSFIALIKNLTPEDLVFMEISFQRTILVSQSTFFLFSITFSFPGVTS